MTEFTRVAVASRAFLLAAIVGETIAFGKASSALGVTAVVIMLAAVASYVSYASAAPTHWVIAVEATVASLIIVSALPTSVVLLPYLVALPLLTGLARGARGAWLVIACHVTASLAVIIAFSGWGRLENRAELLGPWALTIVGAGLLGAWAKKTGKSPAGTAASESYDSARRLLGQLRNLARRLPSGLDPLTIASQILVMAEESTGSSRSAVFTRTEGGVFAPLAYRGAGAQEAIDPNDELLTKVWATGSPAWKPVDGDGSEVVTFGVLPLRLGSDTVGLVASHGPGEIPKPALDALDRDLREMSLRLASALAFDDLRTVVTADERQRLAREIHDGVAQEVASIGYVVDDLAAMTDEPEVASGLKQLRGELSRIVTELRLSIFDLRTEVAESAGLGSALSEYVRKVGSRSTMRVHLSLDEAPTRLSPGVETELFRIAQEAITNARKHSHAENLWVDCWVHPPAALLRVRDDGTGIAGGRADSYGLRIMQERAERIDASLAVEELGGTPGSTGTSVTVSLGRKMPAMSEGMRRTS